MDYRHDVLLGEKLLAELRRRWRGPSDYRHVEVPFEHCGGELIRPRFGEGYRHRRVRLVEGSQGVRKQR